MSRQYRTVSSNCDESGKPLMFVDPQDVFNNEEFMWSLVRGNNSAIYKIYVLQDAKSDHTLRGGVHASYHQHIYALYDFCQLSHDIKSCMTRADSNDCKTALQHIIEEKQLKFVVDGDGEYCCCNESNTGMTTGFEDTFGYWLICCKCGKKLEMEGKQYYDEES